MMLNNRLVARNAVLGSLSVTCMVKRFVSSTADASMVPLKESDPSSSITVFRRMELLMISENVVARLDVAERFW